MKRTLLICLFTLVGSQMAFAAEPTTDKTQPVPDSRPKIMPSSEDITKETAAKIGADEKADDSGVASTLREGGTVHRNGLKYHVFRSSLGILLVPATGSEVKPEDFDAALCSYGSEVSVYRQPELRPAVRAETPEERMVFGAERPLSAKYTAYAGLMTKVMRKKCGPQDPSPDQPLKVTPEVGVQWDGGGKSGGKDKVFVNPKGVGVGKSF